MAGYKDFTSTTLSSADVDSYLMQQAVIQCTSTTRPSPTHEGMLVVETNTDRLVIWTGSAWKSVGYYGAPAAFTVTVTQSFSVAAGGFSDLWYQQVGQIVMGQGQINLSANGSTGAPIYIAAVGLPAAAVAGNCVGSYTLFRSGSGYHAGSVMLDSGTFTLIEGGTQTNVMGASPSFALLSGDRITWDFKYRT